MPAPHAGSFDPRALKSQIRFCPSILGEEHLVQPQAELPLRSHLYCDWRAGVMAPVSAEGQASGHTLARRLFRASHTARTTSQAVMGPALLLLADVSLSWLPFSRKILGMSRSAIFSPTPCLQLSSNASRPQQSQCANPSWHCQNQIEACKVRRLKYHSGSCVTLREHAETDKALQGASWPWGRNEQDPPSAPEKGIWMCTVSPCHRPGRPQRPPESAASGWGEGTPHALAWFPQRSGRKCA